MRNVLKYIGTEWGEGHHFEVHFSKKKTSQASRILNNDIVAGQ